MTALAFAAVRAAHALRHAGGHWDLRRERLLSDLRQEDLVGVVVEDLSRVELSG